jgi:hypothetical protein
MITVHHCQILCVLRRVTRGARARSRGANGPVAGQRHRGHPTALGH